MQLRDPLSVALVGRARPVWTPVRFLLRSFDQLAQNSIRRVFLFAERRLGPLTLLVFVIVAVLMYISWDWLQTTPDAGESGSSTIRNLGLVLAALVALPIAIWRSRVAQIEANTAQRTLSNQLYQQGAEMLQSVDLSVRLTVSTR